MFNKFWFKKHQKKLLWLLNTPIIRNWFRYVLKINGNRSSVGKNKITKIEPNAIFWGGRYFKKKGKWCLERTVEFKTHNKYSKRLFYAFSPLWYLFHCWDMTINFLRLPALNLGYDTLTVYPVAGANTPVDGRVGYTTPELTWANIRANAGNFAAVSDVFETVIWLQGGATTNYFGYLLRGIFLFDTSALTANAVISSATISFFGKDKSDTLGATPTIALLASTPANTNNLVTADNTAFGTTRLADTDLTYAGFSTTGYNDFTLNAAGLANISKTGISKFGIKEGKYDLDNATPPWTANLLYHFQVYFADEAGTTNDPKLVVTYTIGGVVAVNPTLLTMNVG